MFRSPIVTADPGIFAPHLSVASVFHDTESVVEAVGGVVYFVLIDVCDRRVAVIPILQHVTAFATVHELLDLLSFRRMAARAAGDSYLFTRSAVATLLRKANTMSEGSAKSRRMLLDGVGPCPQMCDGSGG